MTPEKTNPLPLRLRLAVDLPWSVKRRILNNRRAWRFFVGGCRRLGWSDECLGWYESRNGPYAGIRLKARNRNHLWVPMGGYEPEISDIIPNWIECGKPAWDVGANVGIVSLLMAEHGASEVLAFEPDQGNSAILLDQVNENPRLSGRVHLLPFAVSDSCGRLPFIANEGSESHIACDKEFGGEIVRCVTLDSMLEERTPPSFVKVDVEGAEVLVLKGSAKLASEHRPTFMIEVHSRKNDSECRGILAAAGYEVRCLSRRDQSNGHFLAVHRSKQ